MTEVMGGRAAAFLSGAYRSVLIAIGLMTLGCAGAPPEKVENIALKVSIQASDDVNPDASASGRASPLRVEMFQLKARTTFEQAGYFALLDDAEIVLDGDLIAVETIVLKPGEKKAFEVELQPTTRFVGVIAGYRDIDQAEWRALVEMPEKALAEAVLKNGLVIKAERLSLSINIDQ